MIGLSLAITAAPASPAIINDLGRRITRARAGDTVHAFLPTVGNPPTTVPSVVWTLGGFTHSGTSFVVPEGVSGTLTWSGTDSLGAPVQSAMGVDVSAADAPPPPPPPEEEPLDPVNDVTPALSGLAQVGETLTVTPGLWANTTEVRARLQRQPEGATSWSDAGSVGATYVLSPEDAGSRLRVREVPDERSALAVVSAPTDVVAALPVDVPAGAAVFGADTPVGTGGLTVEAPDGTYGEFAVVAGVARPAVSPLTVGPAQIGTQTIEVRRDGDRDISVSSEADVIALVPHTLSSAATPDVTLRLRPGTTLAPETTELFGSGFPRPNPVELHGMVRLKFEIAEDGTRTAMTRWRAQGHRAAAGVDPRDAGIAIEGCAFVPATATDTATLILLQHIQRTTFEVNDVRFRGFTALEPFGDYGARIDYAGASGTFQAGEKIAASVWDDRGERTILEVRDNGDGTGTLMVNDGTSDGQAANRAGDAGVGTVISGRSGGATATVSRAAYDTLPATPSGIGVNGNPRPDHVIVRNCDFADLSDVVTVKANASILLEGNTIERYLKDAFTVSPNLDDDPDNAVSPEVTIRSNRVRHPISLATDLGNPHSDGLQINDHPRARRWEPLVLEFNQFMDGQSRGAAQLMFLQGPEAFGSTAIRANIVSGKGSVNTLVGMGDADSLVHNNTVFRELQADGTPYPGFNSPQLSMDGEARYVFNIATQAAFKGLGATASDNAFVKLDGVTGAVPITEYLAGPFHVTDWDDQFAAAQTAGGADPLAGARGTPVDWTAQVVDDAHLPTAATPPVDAPVIVFSMSQSEPVYATESDGPRRILTPPALRAENFTLYQAENGDDNVGPVLKTRLTADNTGTVNPAMVVLANALDHAAPGRQFVLSEAGEPGTSRVSLGDDGDDATERQWIETQKMYDAVLADYPQGFDRMTEYWYAADSGNLNQWLDAYAPYYFGQTADGSAFTLGDFHAPINRGVDHCVYDFETSDPNDPGRGLIPRTVPFDLMRKPPWTNDNTGRWDGLHGFVADDRFQSLGGVYGPPSAAWWSDGAHPILDDPDGVYDAAYDFFMPSMLRAAGLSADESAFTGIAVQPDGSYADVTFAPANGGVLSTKRLVRGQPVIEGDLSQEVYGFEVTRAAGGGMFAFARVGAPDIDTRYHATVVRLDDTTVRITPVEPFANGDTVSFMHGRAFWRDDYTAYPSGWDYQMAAAKYVASLPIEHVAAYTDPGAEHPFAGFPARTYSDVWAVSGVTATGGGGGGGDDTPPAFVMGETGPYFVDPNNVPDDTSIVRHRIRMRVPADVANINGGRILLAQESTGFDVRLTTANGPPVVQISRIETGDGSNVTPSERTIWSGARDTWVEITVQVDQAAAELSFSVDGGPEVTRPFTGASTGTFQSTREISYFATTSGNSLLQPGVEVDFIETYFTTGGVETLHKRIEGAQFASDAWRRE